MPRKLTLIIGNNVFQDHPLKTCVNDATNLAEVLRSVNIEVELQVNLKFNDMYECIEIFTETIQRDVLLFSSVLVTLYNGTIKNSFFHVIMQK
jgi:hypothetical protein